MSSTGSFPSLEKWSAHFHSQLSSASSGALRKGFPSECLSEAYRSLKTGKEQLFSKASLCSSDSACHCSTFALWYQMSPFICPRRSAQHFT